MLISESGHKPENSNFVSSWAASLLLASKGIKSIDQKSSHMCCIWLMEAFIGQKDMGTSNPRSNVTSEAYSGCSTQGLLWNLFCASAVCIDKPRTNVKFLPLCRQKLRQYSDCIFGQCNFPLSYELSLLPCRALELRVTTIQAHIQLNLSLSFCLQWG